MAPYSIAWIAFFVGAIFGYLRVSEKMARDKLEASRDLLEFSSDESRQFQAMKIEYQGNATEILKTLDIPFRPLIEQCTYLVTYVFVAQGVLSVLHYSGINSETIIGLSWLALLSVAAIVCLSGWALWIAVQAFQNDRSIHNEIAQLEDEFKENYLKSAVGTSPA